MNKFFSLFLILLVLFQLSFVVYGQSGICCWDSATTNEDDNENCGNANEDGATSCLNTRPHTVTCDGSSGADDCASLGTGFSWNSDLGNSCDVCESGSLSCTHNIECICSCSPTDTCTCDGTTGHGGTQPGSCTISFTGSGTITEGSGPNYEENADACCAGITYDSDHIVCCDTNYDEQPVLLDFGSAEHPINRAWNGRDQCCYNGVDGSTRRATAPFEVWTVDAPFTSNDLTCKRGDNGDFTPGNDPVTGIDLCPDRTLIGANSGLDIDNDGDGIPNCNGRETTPCFRSGSTDESNVWNITKTYDYIRNGDNAIQHGSRFGYKHCDGCRDLLYDADHCSGCRNTCSTGSAPDGDANAGESQVKDYCSVGLCPCETGCSTSTGYHSKRYARCSQQQFADEFLSWTSDPVSEKKETGGDITEEFGSDPWPPQPGSGTWFPYENDLDGKTHDGNEPYGIWLTYDNNGGKRMDETTWSDFSNDWWGHCPVDFLKSPYHCISTTSPSGSPIYDSGDDNLPSSYFAYNIDQDSSLANACETDCRGNVPMLPCLKKCNRFNQHFRKVVANARAADFKSTNEWQIKLEELCSACHPNNTDIVPDPKIPENYCCENTIECALYTVACQINGEKLVQSWAGADADTYKFSAIPCDDRSPVLPGVYRDKSNRCGESDTDRSRPVHESFGLRHTHIPIKVSTTSDNIGVVVSRDDELRPYGAGFAGELQTKTFDFACVANVTNGAATDISCSNGGQTCIDTGASCNCGNPADNCYRYCNYGSKRTCYFNQAQQDWNTEMIHLIFDPEISDPDVDNVATYTAHIESTNGDWTISVADYKDCVDEPADLTATDFETINFTHTKGHAYVITAIFIGNEGDASHDRVAKVYIKATYN